MKRLSVLLVAVVSFFAGSVSAASVAYSDRAAFLAASGAIDVTPSLTSYSAAFASSLSIDGIVVTNPFGELLFAGAWTPALPGNDIAVNGNENFDIVLPSAVYSFGLDFYEPSGSPSTFTLTFLSGNTPISSLNFDPPEDQVTFMGGWLNQPFNRVELRETTAINQDEYLGHFYTGVTPAGVTPIPAPATIWLFLSGLTTLGLRIPRNKDRRMC